MGIKIGTEDLLNINQAANALGVHRMTIYRWIDNGKIKAVYFGRYRAIHKDEVTRLNDEKEKRIEQEVNPDLLYIFIKDAGLCRIQQIDHPDYIGLFVLTDYKGIFVNGRSVQNLLKELQKSYSKLSDEDIEEISKWNLLRTYPEMYSQCFDTPPRCKE